jgi:hypothetical protein
MNFLIEKSFIQHPRRCIYAVLYLVEPPKAASSMVSLKKILKRLLKVSTSLPSLR